MKEETLCNYEFILTKACAMSVAQVLDDINLALQSPGSVGDKELQLLHDALVISMNALKLDPTQLASQLIGRIGRCVDKKFVNLNSLLQQAMKPSIPNLIPRRECLTRPGNEKPNLASVDMTSLNVENIYMNNSNVNVTTTSKTRKSLTVWNVNTCVPVRTFRNIAADHIVIMKSNKIAVYFDRRIVIIDLDSGEILNKIKGFHYQPKLLDNEHLVTLSRGRRFVKIVNAISGDSITMLKSDHKSCIDRLLVSSVGSVAVCIYKSEDSGINFISWDLKIKQQLPKFDSKDYIFKDSVIRYSSLSDDGEIFVTASDGTRKSSEKQAAVVFDIKSGKVNFGLLYESSQARGLPIGFTCFTISKDIILSGCKDNSLRCWNRINGKVIHSLKGHSRPVQQIRVDEESYRAVTAANHREDNSIRLWDIKDGIPLSCFIPDEIPKGIGITNCGSWIVFSIDKEENLGILGLFSNKSEPKAVNEDRSIDDAFAEIDLESCCTATHDPFDGDDDVDEFEFDAVTIETDTSTDPMTSDDL